jgi:hypothetical protein
VRFQQAFIYLGFARYVIGEDGFWIAHDLWRVIAAAVMRDYLIFRILKA